MCGRFAFLTPPDAMAQLFATRNLVPNVPARYNIAPMQDILVVRWNPGTGQRSLDFLRWGLVPHFAKGPSGSARLINARAEGLAGKPSFRDAFHRRRCLIPADLFYEWQPGGKPKRPFAFRRADGAPFAMAGLWEGWKTPEGDWLKTCTIITTQANPLVGKMHDRMPVIIPPGDHGRWLGEDPASPEALLALLRPFPAEEMAMAAASPAVNSVKNDGPDLLEG